MSKFQKRVSVLALRGGSGKRRDQQDPADGRSLGKGMCCGKVNKLMSAHVGKRSVVVA